MATEPALAQENPKQRERKDEVTQKETSALEVKAVASQRCRPRSVLAPLREPRPSSRCPGVPGDAAGWQGKPTGCRLLLLVKSNKGFRLPQQGTSTGHGWPDFWADLVLGVKTEL